MSSIVYLLIAVVLACCVGAVRRALLSQWSPVRVADRPGPVPGDPPKRVAPDLPRAA